MVSYVHPSSYGDSYRLWLRSLMRGLETTRRLEELEKKNEVLESSLIRDPVTGLFNFRGFTQQIDGLLFKFKGIGDPEIGVLAADIRNLSEINDKDGRTAGDKAIVKLGNLLQESFPEGNVYSFGNGEIIVIDALTSDGRKRFEEAVTEIRQKLSEFTGKHKYSLPVDIYYGIAEGKAEDRNGLERITSVERQADQVNDILDHNRIKYHFQPIVDAHTGEIYAYEALMRPDSVPYIQPPVVLKYAEVFGRLYDVEAATFNNVLNIIDTRTDEFRDGLPEGGFHVGGVDQRIEGVGVEPDGKFRQFRNFPEDFPEIEGTERAVHGVGFHADGPAGIDQEDGCLVHRRKSWVALAVVTASTSAGSTPFSSAALSLRRPRQGVGAR